MNTGDKTASWKYIEQDIQLEEPIGWLGMPYIVVPASFFLLSDL